jgi:AraC-like DNA-binding protein
VFSFGDRAQVEWGQSVRPLPRAYLVGLLKKPCRVHAQGVLKSVAARFYAWGFYPLLGRDIEGSPNTVQALSAEWQDLAAQLGPAVQSEDGEAAVEVLQSYLIERALRVQFDQAVIQAATQQLFEEKGQLKIRDLAAYCRMSARQLERQFNSAVGESPKFLARLARFEETRERLWRDPEVDLATLAHECGYTDQAHLNREFKRFSSRTPRKFVTEMLATNELNSSLGIAFVQDN